MSKKLIIIISGLFLIQVAVYSITHIWNEKGKEDAISNTDDFNNNKSLLSQYPDYETRETIYLGNKELTKLPEELLLFKNLKQLHLEENHLTEFPYEVLQLEHLEVLNLNNNNISEVDLTELNLTNSRLTMLNLRYNELEKAEGLEKLQNLNTLNLRYNNLTSFVLRNESSTKIDLSYNGLTNFPEITAVNNLLLNNNIIEELDLEKLPKKIRKLEINENIINRVTSNDSLDFLNLKKFDLESIYLNGNKLTEFPIAFLDLPNIATLELKSNEIKNWSWDEIPISNSLKKLDLSDNELMVMLVDLNEKMPYLSELSLKNNDFIIMELSHQNLTVINVQGNEAANCTMNLPNLKILYCDLVHINTTTYDIKTPNLTDCYIRTKVGENLDETVLKRYENVSLIYE